MAGVSGGQWPSFHEGTQQNSSCDTAVSDGDSTSRGIPRGQHSIALAVQSPQWLGLAHGSQCWFWAEPPFLSQGVSGPMALCLVPCVGTCWGAYVTYRGGLK